MPGAEVAAVVATTAAGERANAESGVAGAGGGGGGGSSGGDVGAPAESAGGVWLSTAMTRPEQLAVLFMFPASGRGTRQWWRPASGELPGCAPV